ncbi:MAG: DM13 domain-containing protein [Pseudomonadota bacterium]
MLKTKTALLAVALTLALSACGYGTQENSISSNSAATQQAVNLENAELISAGSFSGRSDHETTGKVSLVKTTTGYALVFADDFSLDGAPDPQVGFGKGGSYVNASQVSALQSKTGAQTYALPIGFEPTDYDEVYVWCEQFSVPLGVAKLN